RPRRRRRPRLGAVVLRRKQLRVLRERRDGTLHARPVDSRRLERLVRGARRHRQRPGPRRDPVRRDRGHDPGAAQPERAGAERVPAGSRGRDRVPVRQSAVLRAARMRQQRGDGGSDDHGEREPVARGGHPRVHDGRREADGAERRAAGERDRAERSRVRAGSALRRRDVEAAVREGRGRRQHHGAPGIGSRGGCPQRGAREPDRARAAPVGARVLPRPDGARRVPGVEHVQCDGDAGRELGSVDYRAVAARVTSAKEGSYSRLETGAPRDLGFGTVAAKESRQRFLNADGSFNVRRKGLRFRTTLSLYHSLLTMTWPRFFAVIAGTYLVTNAFFGGLYLMCGPDALIGAEETGLSS